MESGPKKRSYSSSPYIELQTCSNFSFLRGASHPEEIVEQAAALGYPAVALTDYHTFGGIVRAHWAAKKMGISLIVGCRIPLYRSLPQQKDYHEHQDEALEAVPSLPLPHALPCSLLLYPESKAAYSRLSTLLTLGKSRAPKGACFLGIEDLSDCLCGVHAAVLIDNFADKEISSLLDKLKKIFSYGRLSLVIQRTYAPDESRKTALLSDLSNLFQIPLLATNDVHYHCQDRRMLHDVLNCIRRGIRLEEAGFALFQNSERFLKPPPEISRLFAKFPQAVARSAEIAALASCFSLDELRYEYPREVCPEGTSPQEHLSKLVWESVETKYPAGLPQQIRDLIEHELRLIAELDYARYFLTVFDIVSFARSQGILCQGRGAAANSAVCYLLGITSVDPSKIDLLFERFISKERNEPPDIDIDFEHERREEVIQYIYQKYGRDRAALAAAVITYRRKSAVRDVGTVFGLAPETIEKIKKLLTRTQDGELSAEALKAQGLNPKDKRIQKTIELSLSLLGFPRHLSQHPGGFIISEAPLSSLVPIENAAMPERSLIEWDKDDIDRLGILKIDILALGMLTCIRKAFSLINERLPADKRIPQKVLKLHSIPPEDPEVYEMISRADTVGVFQIESRAQMSMLPRLKPRCFYDLVIEVAIVRPGPIQGGMVHPYLRRRTGKEVASYPSSEIRKILESTLGVPIFQEQVMQLAVTAGGFSKGEADELRRAMASWKKSSKLIAQFEQRLIQGMRSKGYTLRFAQQIFQQIKGFGEYGFPQSHAASFALLVYVSAWLKHHHPAAFAAALLNSQPMGFYQPAQIVRDARNHGVDVRPIDINYSTYDCSLEGEPPALRLGLRLISGLGEREAKRIIHCVKQNGRFKSLADLWRKSGASVSSLKILAKADAFSSLGFSRQAALWEIRRFRDEPLELFNSISSREDLLPNLPPPSRLSHVAHDYQSQGFSLRAHPLVFIRPQLKAKGVTNSWEFKNTAKIKNGSSVILAGMVLMRQKPLTASGVVFLTLEDETDTANIIIRPQIFSRYREIICDSRFLLVSGRVQHEENVTHLMASSFSPLDHCFC